MRVRVAVWLVLTVATLILAGGGSPARAARAHQVRRGAPAAWVVPIEPDLAAVAPDQQIDEGVYELLLDAQVRATGRNEDSFSRHVWRVVASTGITTSSQIEIAFDPTYQQLVLHHVRITRGGRVRELVDTAELRVVQREQDLERRMLDGSLSALIVLPDVRVGDVVDYAFTLTGANPLLDGHWADSFAEQHPYPVHHLHQRILWSGPRPLAFKTYRGASAPRVQTRDGARELVWDRRDLPALATEDEVPDWFAPFPWVQLSDFTSWQEVAEWTARLLPPPTVDPALTELVGRLRAEHPTEEDRILAAIHFVQDEVRYFGMEIGPHSHEPHTPATVLANRFGDCKDKSVLLAALLRELGVEAAPALVSTMSGHSLEERLPSPFAFDHMIVRLRHGGETHWVDATATHQRGSLDDLAVSRFERALVIAPGTRALEPVADKAPSSPTMVVEERFDLGAKPMTLAVTTRYRGAEADQIRRNLARGSREELGRKYENFYAGTFEDIRAVGLPAIKDDVDANVVTVDERYELATFWDDGYRDLYAHALGDNLRRPRTRRRHMPLAVEHPVYVEQTIRLFRPEGRWDTPTSQGSYDHGPRHLNVSVKRDGKDLVATFAYRTTGDHVDVAETAAHLAQLGAMNEALSTSVPEAPAVPSRRAGPRGEAVGKIIGLIFGAFLLILIALKIGQRVRMRWRKRRYDHDAGEAPGTALLVGGLDELGATLAHMRCSCGGRLARAEGTSPDDEGVRYDGRDLLAMRLRCQRCGEKRTRYVELIARAS